MPSYLACQLSTGKAKSRQSSSRASTMRADSRAAVAGLFQNRLAVFARLAEIDVDGVNVVAFVLEPAEDDGGIEAAGIGENAGGHGEGVRDQGWGVRENAIRKLQYVK